MSKWSKEQRAAAYEQVTDMAPDCTADYEMAGRILSLEAELAAMRPVVEAAERWNAKDVKVADAIRLSDAVDAYRAQREGK